MVNVVYEPLTKRNVSWYVRICNLFSVFPELSQNYQVLVIFFVDTLTPLPVYNQKLSKYSGVQCKQSLPPKARATALKGIGAITVRVDILDKKSKPLCEFILLEEFCHLLDYKGDSTPEVNGFWAFTEKYKRVEDNTFAEKVAYELNTHFNHFNVNKLLMERDLSKWLKFRKDHYGKQLRQRTKPFYEKITTTHNQKGSLAIMLTEMIKVISFLRAIETFIQENRIETKNKEKIEKIILSVKKTISHLEAFATLLDPASQNIISSFPPDSFKGRKHFFDKVSQLWLRLGLIQP